MHCHVNEPLLLCSGRECGLAPRERRERPARQVPARAAACARSGGLRAVARTHHARAQVIPGQTLPAPARSCHTPSSRPARCRRTPARVSQLHSRPAASLSADRQSLCSTLLARLSRTGLPLGGTPGQHVRVADDATCGLHSARDDASRVGSCPRRGRARAADLAGGATTCALAAGPIHDHAGHAACTPPVLNAGRRQRAVNGTTQRRLCSAATREPRRAGLAHLSSRSPRTGGSRAAPARVQAPAAPSTASTSPYSRPRCTGDYGVDEPRASWPGASPAACTPHTRDGTRPHWCGRARLSLSRPRRIDDLARCRRRARTRAALARTARTRFRARRRT